MNEVTVEELRRFTEGMPVGIFDGLSTEQLDRVARITRREAFAMGDVIIADGADGNRMYLLLSGKVRVDKPLSQLQETRFVQHDREIIELPAEWNPYFGELALFDAESVRTANVVGAQAGEHGVITTEDFRALADEDHDIGYCVLRNVLAKAIGTIRSANQNLHNLVVAMQVVGNVGFVEELDVEGALEGGDAYMVEFIKETLGEVARLRSRVASFAQFYTAGGTLGADAPSYVPRPADQTIHASLANGEFCYVLTARQMGKSSLMARAARRLREGGAAVVMIDLAAIGQNLTVEQWYDGLMARIGDGLGLEDELEEFWEEHAELGPLNRWVETIRRVALRLRQERIVLFVDEVDVVKSLPFSTDEFFAAIRACHNMRVEHAEFERLTFCLLGAATPLDLIRDRQSTPFNVSRPVELADFTIEECATLAHGLGYDPDFAGQLIERAYHWTDGHPYLTQRLCRAVSEESAVTSVDEVDRICEELFLSPRSVEQDSNLSTVRDRLLRNPQYSGPALRSLLGLYRDTLGGVGKHVGDDDPRLAALELAGIVRTGSDGPVVRNRIYAAVFGQAWVDRNTPPDSGAA